MSHKPMSSKPMSRKWWIVSGLVVGLICSGVGLFQPFNLRVPQSITITIDLAQRYQTIEGFGTCLVTWIEDLQDLFQTAEFQHYYVEELGATLLRIEMWPDVSLKEIDDWREISYTDFDFSGAGQRGQVFIDFIEATHHLGPDGVKLIGTVWSPPAWMKQNGLTSNGNPNRQNFSLGSHPESPYVVNNTLRSDRYQHFAKWLVEWVKLLQAKGIELYALSPQNEPMFSQWYNSAVYSPDHYQKLIKTVGIMFEQEAVTRPLIFGPEHVTRDLVGNHQYLQAILNRPDVRPYFDVIATHGYIDGVAADQNPQTQARFAQLIHDLDYPYWITEAGTGPHDWPGALNGLAAQLHYSLVRGQASAFLPWQVVDLDPTTHNLMTINTPTPKTYAAIHYFKFIRPGAIRVQTDPDSQWIEASAFWDQDRGTITVVALNRHPVDITVTLTFKHLLQDYPQLSLFRTSISEQLAQQPDPIWSETDDAIELMIPATSLITLQGHHL